MKRKRIISSATIIFIFLAIIIFISLSLDACGKTPHAVATVTTSDGMYTTVSSSTNANEARKNTIWVVRNEEVTVKVYFACPTCRYVEEWTALTTELKSKMFVCECNFPNEIKGKPEYFCIGTASGDDYFGVIEEKSEEWERKVK